MAQTETVTNTGIAEWVVLMSDASSPAATAANKIVCLTDNSSAICTAAVASTFANPADACTHWAGSGLSIAAATMGQAQTNTAGDTITFDKVFTCSGTSCAVAGIHLCNDDGDVTFVECCFAALVTLNSSDTLTIDGAVVVDQA